MISRYGESWPKHARAVFLPDLDSIPMEDTMQATIQQERAIALAETFDRPAFEAYCCETLRLRTFSSDLIDDVVQLWDRAFRQRDTTAIDRLAAYAPRPHTDQSLVQFFDRLSVIYFYMYPRRTMLLKNSIRQATDLFVNG